MATISTLPQAAVDNKFSNPSVIVVGKVCSLHDQLGWFEQRPLYGRSIVVPAPASRPAAWPKA